MRCAPPRCAARWRGRLTVSRPRMHRCQPMQKKLKTAGAGNGPATSAPGSVFMALTTSLLAGSKTMPEPAATAEPEPEPKVSPLDRVCSHRDALLDTLVGRHKRLELPIPE